MDMQQVSGGAGNGSFHVAAGGAEPCSLIEAAQQAERTARPQPGDQFEHKHLLSPEGGYEPARGTVTAVRGGRVYWTYAADYQAGDRQGRRHFPVSDVAGYVRRWL